eukprot:TRINITY_DN7856_c0_g1_i1.p1 TRINITY_DN7856_c0_g1~~TRINITY_DN7856_c0_g1_i1.p1  ORF type:complete len:315 (+),score=69.96 TRINITY_DN7856_c0_g1_i1:116-1060(+)
MYSIVIRTAGRGSVAQVNVEVEQSDNVAVLKQLIELMHPDAPKPSRQRLIYGGSVLNDHQVFSEIFAMAPGGGPHTIHLVVSEAATTTTSSTESSARPEPSSQQGSQYTSYQSPQGSQFPLGSHGNFMPRVNPQAIPVADNITADAYQHYVNYMAYWSSMGVVPGYTFPQFVEHVLPAIMAQMQTNIPARPMAPLDPNARADPGVEAAPRPAEQNRNPAGNDFDNFTQLLMKGFVIYMLMSQYGETKRWALLGFLVLIWYLNKLGYISLNYEFRRYYGMRDRQEAAEQQNGALVSRKTVVSQHIYIVHCKQYQN